VCVCVCVCVCVYVCVRESVRTRARERKASEKPRKNELQRQGETKGERFKGGGGGCGNKKNSNVFDGWAEIREICAKVRFVDFGNRTALIFFMRPHFGLYERPFFFSDEWHKIMRSRCLCHRHVAV